MRKLLNKPWFVAMLALAALAFVAKSVLMDSTPRPRRRVPLAVDAPLPSADGEEPANDAAPATLREALLALVIPTRLMDPFASRGGENVASGPVRAAEPDQVESVHLSAIWSQGPEIFLLVNDRICRAGESVGRLTIESATIDGVWFTHWKGRDFVRLGGDFTLVTPARQPANPTLALNER